jgi:hypothetical protein
MSLPSWEKRQTFCSPRIGSVRPTTTAQLELRLPALACTVASESPAFKFAAKLSIDPCELAGGATLRLCEVGGVAVSPPEAASGVLLGVLALVSAAGGVALLVVSDAGVVLAESVFVPDVLPALPLLALLLPLAPLPWEPDPLELSGLFWLLPLASESEELSDCDKGLLALKAEPRRGPLCGSHWLYSAINKKSSRMIIAPNIQSQRRSTSMELEFFDVLRAAADVAVRFAISAFLLFLMTVHMSVSAVKKKVRNLYDCMLKALMV